MQLTNKIIQEDLHKIYKNKNQFISIVLYLVIIVLFICFVSMSISQQITIIDTLAGILCKISLFSFSLIVLEGATLSMYNFLKKDEVIEENYWSVIEANLTKKTKSGCLLEFLGGYKYNVSKDCFNEASIGERYYLVVVNKPGYSVVKHEKVVLNIYKKDNYLKYSDEQKFTNRLISNKQKLDNKMLKKDLFLFNLPEIIEILLSALTISCVMGTVFQVIKQQYFTFIQNYLTYLILIIVFTIVLILLNKIQRYDKDLKIKNCLLIEENDNFVLVVKKNKYYILVKIYPKYKFVNLNNLIEEQKR